jgi:hypothetical protein
VLLYVLLEVLKVTTINTCGHNSLNKHHSNFVVCVYINRIPGALLS